MSWFSKAIKKVKIKDVAKAVSKAKGLVNKAADFLPAPLGVITKGATALLSGVAKKGKKDKAQKMASGGSFLSRVPKTATANRLLKQTASNIKKLKKMSR